MASLDFRIVSIPHSYHIFQPGDTVRLGGYFVPMSVARDLATDLGLSVGDDTIISNAHLESGFNGWLAEHNKFHILAAAITWPRRLDSDFGIIFISKFAKGGPEAERLEEDDEALQVRNDLEGWSRKSKLQLQWASLVDNHNITLRGTRPRPNPPIFVQRSLAEMMAFARSPGNHFRTTGERQYIICRNVFDS
jgi:hypothetical protein